MAYLHPAAMLVLLGLCLFILREGLRIRRGRLTRRPVDSRRHRKLARWVVPLLAVGFASGLASMVWLRDQSPFDSVHFILVTPAVVGMLAGGAIGLKLERGGSPSLRNLHAALGALGLLLGLAGAVAGFAILP